MSSITLPPGTQLEAGTLQFLSDTRLLWIDGGWTAPLAGKTFPTLNPANGQTLTEISLAEAPDVHQAVQAARKAFETTWRRVLPARRSALLWKLADLIEANEQVLSELETLDNGKPLAQARADVKGAAKHFRYYAGWPTKIEGSTIPVSAPDKLVYTKREPLGVVGLITPWNFPLAMAAWKLAPALACGNTVVLKPAEQTPLTTLLLGVLARQAGFPDGVVNIVTGPGQPTGEAMTLHPDIDKIGFTGSTQVGKKIMEAAAQSNLKKVSLELGGKSPNIFFEDVARDDDDFFDKAIEGFVMVALNQGEVCTCPSRALIHEKIYDRFMTRALARVAAIRQGDPLDPETMIGAQASSEQMEKILSYIDIGRQEGAEVLAGGARNTLSGPLAGGFFVQPTVLRGHNRMRVFQEEIFGPVVSVTTFRDDEDALAMANDTLYGLGAGIWSRDVNRCYRFGRAIQAGRVWTNCYHAYPAHAAFGGYKHSGIGRETHKMMLNHYQQTKNMLVSYSPKKLGFY